MTERTYLVMSIFCILTQALDPVLMFKEPPTTPHKAKEGKFEHNVYYYTRNGLTTLATLIFTYYNLRYTYLLQKILKEQKSLKEAALTKVILQCLLIEFIVLQKVVMIWSNNYFWYSQRDNHEWLYFIVIFEVTSTIIPFSIFILVLVQRIIRHKEMSNEY